MNRLGQIILEIQRRPFPADAAGLGRCADEFQTVKHIRNYNAFCKVDPPITNTSWTHILCDTFHIFYQTWPISKTFHLDSGLIVRKQCQTTKTNGGPKGFRKVRRACRIQNLKEVRTDGKPWTWSCPEPGGIIEQLLNFQAHICLTRSVLPYFFFISRCLCSA